MGLSLGDGEATQDTCVQTVEATEAREDEVHTSYFAANWREVPTYWPSADGTRLTLDALSITGDLSMEGNDGLATIIVRVRLYEPEHYDLTALCPWVSCGECDDGEQTCAEMVIRDAPMVSAQSFEEVLADCD